MVEGASLENWSTGNRTGGSNPSLSATQSGVQRNPLVVPGKSCEIPRQFVAFIVKPDQRKSFVLALT